MNLGFLIDNAVQRYGDRVAVDDGRRTFTFRELGARVDRLGAALLALGLAKGDCVASFQYNSIETIEIDLAAAKFGFCRTFLNARGDATEHVNALETSRARVLFFGREQAPLVEAFAASVPGIEHYVGVECDSASLSSVLYEEMIARAAPRPVPHAVSGDDIHSIYYTSGTTGRAKGVVLNQSNWLASVRNHLVDILTVRTDDEVALHVAPMSHASGAFAVSYLLRGARQVVQRRFDAEEAVELIRRHKVTTTLLAPTMISLILERTKVEPSWMASLHTLVYGGAPMAATRIYEAAQRLGAGMIQSYGQWEAPQSFVCLGHREHAQAVADRDLDLLSAAGRPVTHARIGIMDEGGRLLPPGAHGEVVTAGDHLMVGYLGKPEETARLREGIWQRTGDIGHIGENGVLYLTDRRSDAIVTGGMNVFPRQIEEVLHRYPGLVELVAIGIPDTTWGERIHAVVVPRDPASFVKEEFLQWCAGNLVADKRPRSVDLVGELPKNHYGKILRRQVRDLYWQDSERKI